MGLTLSGSDVQREKKQQNFAMKHHHSFEATKRTKWMISVTIFLIRFSLSWSICVYVCWENSAYGYANDYFISYSSFLNELNYLILRYLTNERILDQLWERKLFAMIFTLMNSSRTICCFNQDRKKLKNVKERKKKTPTISFPKKKSIWIML